MSADLLSVDYVTSPANLTGLIIPPKMYNRFVNHMGIRFKSELAPPSLVKRGQVFAIEAPAKYWGLVVPSHLVEKYMNNQNFELNYNGDSGTFDYPFGGYKIKDLQVHGASQKVEESIKNAMVDAYGTSIDWEYIGYDERRNLLCYFLGTSESTHYSIVVLTPTKEIDDAPGREVRYVLKFKNFFQMPVEEVNQYFASRSSQGFFDALKKWYNFNEHREAHKYAIMHNKHV